MFCCGDEKLLSVSQEENPSQKFGLTALRISSLILTVAVAVIYTYFDPQLTKARHEKILLFVLCSWAMFPAFKYPAANPDGKSKFRIIGNFFIHSVLACGFGFFYFLLFGAGAVSELLSDNLFPWFFIACIPLAVGVFVYFFFSVLLRFQIHNVVWVLLSFVSIICVAVWLGLVFNDNYTAIYFAYLLAIFVMVVGVYLILLPVVAISQEVPTKTVILEITLFTGFVTLYFTLTRQLLLPEMSSESELINMQVFWFFYLLILLAVLDWFLVTLKRVFNFLTKRSVLMRSPPKNNRSNVSVGMFFGRASGSLLANFSVMAFPVSFLIYRRIAQCFERRVESARKLVRPYRGLPFRLGLGATIVSLLTCTAGGFLFVYGQDIGDGNFAKKIECGCNGLAAFIAWVSLYEVSRFYENLGHQTEFDR